MKVKLLIIGILTLVCGYINAQPGMKEIIRPVLTDSSEILDIAKYKELGTVLKEVGYDENDKEYHYISVRYNSHKDGVEFRLYGTDGSGYSIKEIADDSYFVVAKAYYPNGKIRTKLVTLNTAPGLFIGPIYKYDKDGNLNYAMADDEGFDFTIEQVLHYLLEVEKVPLKTGFLTAGMYHPGANIKILKENRNYQWEITWYDKEKSTDHNHLVTILLDGKTGDVVSRTETEEPLGN